MVEVPTNKSASKGLVTKDDCGEICGESIKSDGIKETTHYQRNHKEKKKKRKRSGGKNQLWTNL